MYPEMCPEMSANVSKCQKCPKMSKHVQKCPKMSKTFQKYAYVIYGWPLRKRWSSHTNWRSRNTCGLWRRQRQQYQRKNKAMHSLMPQYILKNIFFSYNFFYDSVISGNRYLHYFHLEQLITYFKTHSSFQSFMLGRTTLLYKSDM